MFHGDDVLYNDEQRLQLKEASRKAAQTWRFRHVQSRGLRALSDVVETLGDAARDALAAARRRSERARDRRPLTLTEQR